MGVTGVLVGSGPCRWCGREAFVRDDLGWVHPCCEGHGAADCPGCIASEAARREWLRVSKVCPRCGARARFYGPTCPGCTADPTRRHAKAALPTRAQQRRASIEAGREGADRAERHADPDWKHRAEQAIRRTAALMERFTSDDVWDVGGLDPTDENRALGPLMTAAAKAGLIVATNDFTTTRQVRSHGSPARVWRSMVYEP